jgi:hypothetical protein
VGSTYTSLAPWQLRRPQGQNQLGRARIAYFVKWARDGLGRPNSREDRDANRASSRRSTSYKLVAGPLGIDQTIDLDSATAHYGKPLWFAESDMSAHSPPSRIEYRWNFNPWENPTTISGQRFLLSYALFAGPLCGLAWVLTRALRQRSRSAGLTE